MDLSILYRGPLASCNYGCGYCPFAKQRDTREEVAADAAALDRFVRRVGELREHTFGILVTPWGEALVRKHYWQAFTELSRWPHVRRIACQTNLSCRLDWLDDCDVARLALWCTYHPGETPRGRFVAKCHELRGRGVSFSVGIVGMQNHLAEIDVLRRELPKKTYLWVNAYKRQPDYYTAEQIADLTAIDPLFPVNNRRHDSLGRACRTGETVFSVDGEGVMRRCHFVKQPIGDFYAADWQDALRPRLCPNATCGCHIGYAHMPERGYDAIFGEGILERVPLRLRGHAVSN
jgi:hypothetical protein